MKNIVDTTFELIKEKGEVSIDEIKNAISDLKDEIPADEIEASIYSDLLNDGRFIYAEGKWDLTQNFTMKQIVKEQYKVLGNIDPLDEVLADPIDDNDTPLGVISVDENDDELLDLTEIDDISEIKVYSQADDDKN